jgi:hypothetical protein
MVKFKVVLVLRLPLVPVTVSVAVVGGRGVGVGVGAGVLLPPPPQETPPRTNTRVSTVSNVLAGLCLFIPQSNPAINPPKTNGKVTRGEGVNLAFAVFVTVTVRGTFEVLPVRLAGLGLTEHVDPPGAPVHVKLTAPVKPPGLAKFML